jgi:hypothetical protein
MNDKDKTIMEKLGDAVSTVVETVSSATEAEIGPKPEDLAGTAYANYAPPAPMKAGPRRQPANKRVAKAAKAKSAKAPAKKSAPEKTAKKSAKKKKAKRG